MDDHQLLVSVAEKYTKLRPAGQDRLIALCPIHGEKTPSFWIYPDGHFHCYGCGEGGDAIDLHRSMTGDSYIDAKKALGLWDETRPKPRPKPKPWPTSYQTDDRRKAYVAARRSVVAGKDMDIIYKGKRYMNYQFIGLCLRSTPNYYDYVERICMDIAANAKTDLDRQVLPDIFFECVLDVIEQQSE